MFGIGWTEILVILVVALLVLGPDRLPGIARSLGRGLRDFRKAMHALDEDEDSPRPAGWTGPVPPGEPGAASPTRTSAAPEASSGPPSLPESLPDPGKRSDGGDPQ
ncbi:twin-arginine translocase TatA/TatE family subunit [Myxococcota bacterium]|nr:twin-arginine translocase TatA/TatE family subunit [Myxococcota bacterium]